jgi:glycosyltransferase involved in cell wall biosynthesis
MYPTAQDPAFGTFVRDEVEALRSLGASMDVLLLNGKVSRWNYVWGVFRLWRRLREHRYDVVHAHYVLAGFIGRLQRSVPLVVTFHGAEVAIGWPARVSRWLRDRCDAIIVTSRRVREDLGAPGARVIPPGIDFSHFRPEESATARKRLGLPSGKELILFAGRMDWDKRLEAVQRTVSLLQARRPDAELVLLSGQPHEIVPSYMNACDALLLISTYEGSPMVVKEALACNLPVVSSDVGDVAEMIGDVEGCALCDGSPEDAARKLDAVLGRGRLQRGREAVAHVSLEQSAVQVLEVYATLAPGATS